MMLAKAIPILKHLGVLPQACQISPSTARIIRSGDAPVLLRVNLLPYGFIDLFLSRNGASPSLAAAGSGIGEMQELRYRHPDVFLEDVQVDNPSDNASTLLGTLFDFPLDGPYLPRSGTKCDWLCGELSNVQQPDEWCVPACMSILSLRIMGGLQPFDPCFFASKWKQAPGKRFLPNIMYKAFRDFCIDRGMEIELEYTGHKQPLDWARFNLFARPALVAFDEHAEVLVGACPLPLAQKGYCVLNPGLLGKAWLCFPELAPLKCDFSFLAPGAVCPAQIIP